MCPGMEGFNYKERLDRLGLFPLEFSWLLSNLMEDYEGHGYVDSQRP